MRAPLPGPDFIPVHRHRKYDLVVDKLHTDENAAADHHAATQWSLAMN